MEKRYFRTIISGLISFPIIADIHRLLCCVETENGLEETIEVDTQNIEQAGIESIFSDTDIMTPMNVYDLNGRIIYFNATLEQIKGLDKGLYIIKGKKVMIK